MKIIKDVLARKIVAHLKRNISVEEFTNWEETAMIESDYQEEYFDEIAEIIAKIGVINVEGFELSVVYYLNSLLRLNFQTVFGLKPANEATKEEKFSYV